MKLSVQDYVSIIKDKKQQAQNNNWLYIELNANQLVNECEPKVANVKSAAQAMLDTMLEGDYFIVIPKVNSKLGKDLTVCYYCYNLHPSRKTFAEVNA